MKEYQFHRGRHHFEGVDFSYRFGLYCEFHEPWTNHPHFHEEYYEICLVTSGRGVFHHGNQKFTLEKGDVFVADPLVVHEIASPDTRDLCLVFGTFNLDVRGKSEVIEGNLLRSFDHSHHIHQRLGEEMLPYLDLLSRRRNKGHLAWDASLGLAFMLELIGQLVDGEISNVESNSLLDRARIKVEEWGERDFVLEELAKACGVSLRTLRKEVTDKTRQSLGDWVHGLRLERATRMLQMNFRVGETARACGYEDPDRFARLFRKRFGMTPKRYQLKEFKGQTTFMEEGPR